MARRMLDYETPVVDSGRGWRNGDTVVLCCALLYALFNFVLMMMYAGNMLGPVPFSLIFIFVGVSLSGVVAAFPAQIAFRRYGVTWRGALASMGCFGALTGFNLWCLSSASAAV